MGFRLSPTFISKLSIAMGNSNARSTWQGFFCAHITPLGHSKQPMHIFFCTIKKEQDGDIFFIFVALKILSDTKYGFPELVFIALRKL